MTVDADRGRAVAAWLAGRGEPVREPLAFTALPGGRSNLTYLVTDAVGRHWVLRRPPLASLHRSAHDVLREHRIMAALWSTAVPVPRMVGGCADPAPLDAPFFVMEFVEGTVLADRDTAERALDPASRARAGASVVDALATLHAVDPAGVGLGDLARPDGYVLRQLRAWGRQLDRVGDDGALRDLMGRLGADVPAGAEGALVHGDFRPGNLIVGPDGGVRAVLDWELCTLGDPLADLGWLLAYWGADSGLPVPTLATGFPSRDEVLARYARLTGRSVDGIDYYVAFALWRLAVILSGVRARHRAGAYGSAAAQPGLTERIEAVTAAAAAATGAAGR